MKSYCIILLFLMGNAVGFLNYNMQKSTTSCLYSQNLCPRATNENSKESIFKNLKKLVVFTTAGLTLSIQKANAGAVEDANNLLSNYGFPPLLFIPPGFLPVVAQYGLTSSVKGAVPTGEKKLPVLVQFARPSNWIIGKTSVNVNGESGTVSANDYLKGDSAFFYAASNTDAKPINEKTSVAAFILKSLSQKGDVVEGFKLKNLEKGPQGLDGQQYYLADITYSLNTEAGFLINRKGVASVTTLDEDKFTQGLITVTTDKRWKTLEGTVRDVASSFRVYKLPTAKLDV